MKGIAMTETQREFSDTQGYLVLEDVLKGDQLSQIQETFERVAAETQPEWQAVIDRPPGFKPYGLGPTAHVVYPVVTHDDIFLDVLTHSETHFGMKQHDPCVLRGAFRERMEREGSPLCKQLLGIERMDRAA